MYLIKSFLIEGGSPLSDHYLSHHILLLKEKRLREEITDVNNYTKP